jgi:hypothetical protein
MYTWEHGYIFYVVILYNFKYSTYVNCNRNVVDIIEDCKDLEDLLEEINRSRTLHYGYMEL